MQYLPDESTRAAAKVLRVAALPALALASLLCAYGLWVSCQDDDDSIPGSYWGAPEAGLVGSTLHICSDTPVHSALHEACHFICMDAGRRAHLHTDAGGSDDEENAVCYLQILLADRLIGYSRSHMLEDMDRWGYSFRLGSARAWFETDADDARGWLQQRGLLTADIAATGNISEPAPRFQ